MIFIFNFNFFILLLIQLLLYYIINLIESILKIIIVCCPLYFTYTCMNITEVLRIYIDLRGRVEKHESKIWQVRQGKF